MNTTKEGHQWTPEGGLQSRLVTTAVVQPASNVVPDITVYDVIIIGAGYAGIIAARDLATTGTKVLLLEARDRIGGRTYTANVDGHLFEMGGTYIHWGQANVWREVSRYSMQKRVDATVDLATGTSRVSLRGPDDSSNISDEEHTAAHVKALQKFFNVDGMNGLSLIPFPHNPAFNPAAADLDKITTKDRLDEIRPDLSTTEYMLLESFFAVLNGAMPDDTSMYEALRLWAICGYSAEGLVAMASLFKLHDGQSFLARKIFDEAVESGNLSYEFSCAVTSVLDNDSGPQCIEVETASGQTFKARKVISSIPHNVLDTVTFRPPLTDEKRHYLGIHHINQSIKVHAEVQPAELRSWSGVVYPIDNVLIRAGGEATTPSGNAHLVCFGARGKSFHPEAQVDDLVSAVKRFDDQIEVKRLVFHSWVSDPYSKGAWSVLPRGFASGGRDALSESHGNLHFASSDWALGWRGFIDGAIEQGAQAARLVKEQLREHPASGL